LLLILGEPGSGKTTTLLDLARTLLDRSGDDIKERVPIILNLSSWKKQPLAEWMLDELSEKYRVPRKIARFWLQNNYLLPLLDGLDEVQTDLQPDCLTAINTFIGEFNPSGLVVCCRLNEYRWLPERLKLNGAICLEALGTGEVAEYLKRGGRELAALREAIASDGVLQELAQTPLMLTIMSLAFQGAGADDLATQEGNSLEERRRQIFRLYVEELFRRRGKAFIVFPKEKIIDWLSWLAGRMREHSQSVFLVEGLQPSWLGTRAKRVQYGTVVAMTLGLIFALIGGLGGGLIFALIGGLGIGFGCWSESPLKNGVMSGLIAGLIFGPILGPIVGPIYGSSVMLINGLLVGLSGGLIAGVGGAASLNHINLVETISWKWNLFWRGMIRVLIGGPIIGLLVGPMVGLTGVFNEGPIRATIYGLGFGLIGGLIFGVMFGLVGGLVGGMTVRVKVGKAFPNEGIKLSRKFFLVVFLVTALSLGLLLWVLVGLIGGLTRGLIAGLISGLISGLIVGLNRGGSAVIKYYALRLILWLNGYTPFKFIKFLDQCAKLIFLKKVGGGCIFIHRMLLEYFADISVEHTCAKR
jgi:hypothetical protein